MRNRFGRHNRRTRVGAAHRPLDLLDGVRAAVERLRVRPVIGRVGRVGASQPVTDLRGDRLGGVEVVEDVFVGRLRFTGARVEQQ